MRIKQLVDEDFIQYQNPCMFIGTCFCSFKCGSEYCQNSSLAKASIIDMEDDYIIQRYLQNPITSSIVFGGLEPFDQINELKEFLHILREKYNCFDMVVIYSGYTEQELSDKKIDDPNLIVKVGRYIPNAEKRFDELLGVTLASDNQYAVRW